MTQKENLCRGQCGKNLPAKQFYCTSCHSKVSKSISKTGRVIGSRLRRRIKRGITE